jgi:pre-mRNA-splicing factor ATP-dependent RNA helicase DHX38/PRP16
MIEFPLDPPLAKILLASQASGCLDEALTLVSMLSVPSVFFRPRERLEESDAARERLSVVESDHLTLLNVFRLWKAHGSSDSWCVANFVHPKAMRRAEEVRLQLLDILRQQGTPRPASCGANWDLLRRSLASAYVLKVARAKGLDSYNSLLTGMQCCLHPTSALFGLGYTPDYVIYHELIMTSKEFMQCATAVEPRWLAEACPALFSLRVSSLDSEGVVTSQTINFGEKPSASTKTQPTPQSLASGQSDRTDDDRVKIHQVYRASPDDDPEEPVIIRKSSATKRIKRFL